MMPQKEVGETMREQADPAYGRYEGTQTSSTGIITQEKQAFCMKRQSCVNHVILRIWHHLNGARSRAFLTLLCRVTVALVVLAHRVSEESSGPFQLMGA